MFICVAFKCKLNTGARSWFWGVRKGSMSSNKWKPSLLSDERPRFIVSVCRILFYVVICTTAAVVAYSWNLFSIIGVYSNMASWWILFVTIFFSTTHNKFEPNNIGWSGTTPGRAGSCFYLVGWSDYLLSWWKRSFFPSLRHSRLCGFWLGLVPPPFTHCIRWGLILRLFEWGGIHSCSKSLSDSVWLVSLVPKQCLEENCIE